MDNETPLSLIEDSYCASFSVTRYFVENSVEPVRVIVNALKKDEKEKKCEKEKDVIVESQSDVVTYGQIFFGLSPPLSKSCLKRNDNPIYNCRDLECGSLSIDGAILRYVAYG